MDPSSGSKFAVSLPQDPKAKPWRRDSIQVPRLAKKSEELRQRRGNSLLAMESSNLNQGTPPEVKMLYAGSFHAAGSWLRSSENLLQAGGLGFVKVALSTPQNAS
jgi:hypothetical protein